MATADWGEGWAWVDLQWSDAALPPESTFWPRLESLPAVGRDYLLRVSPDFSDSDSEFDALFRPAFSAENGWFEAPRELEKSAIIRCRPREMVAGPDGQVWLRVESLLVTPLVELVDMYSPRDPLNGMGWLEGDSGQRWRCASGSLWLLEMNAESDVGAWAVCVERRGQLSMVLFSEWAIGDSDHFAIFGHRGLSPKQQQHLRTRFYANCHGREI